MAERQTGPPAQIAQLLASAREHPRGVGARRQQGVAVLSRHAGALQQQRSASDYRTKRPGCIDGAYAREHFRMPPVARRHPLDEYHTLFGRKFSTENPAAFDHADRIAAAHDERLWSYDNRSRD